MSSALMEIPRKEGSDKPICGATTRAGTVCQQPAGYKTAHAGSGRCKYHGGAAPNAVMWRQEGKAVVKGATLRLVDLDLARRSEELSQDEDLLTLHREIGMARAMLETSLDKDEQHDLMDLVGKLVIRAHRIEMQRKGLVQVHIVRSILEAVRRGIDIEVSSPELHFRLLQRINSLAKTYLQLIQLESAVDITK